MTTIARITAKRVRRVSLPPAPPSVTWTEVAGIRWVATYREGRYWLESNVGSRRSHDTLVGVARAHWLQTDETLEQLRLLREGAR